MPISEKIEWTALLASKEVWRYSVGWLSICCPFGLGKHPAAE